MNQENYKIFDRVSKLIEFILAKYDVPAFIKTFILVNIWSNEKLLIEVDKEVQKLWQMKLK